MKHKKKREQIQTKNQNQNGSALFGKHAHVKIVQFVIFFFSSVTC